MQMTLLMLCASALTAAAEPPHKDAPYKDAPHKGAVWSYTVSQDNVDKPVHFKITQNVMTSAHFNYPVAIDDVMCGNISMIKIVPTRDNTQLNLTALPQARAGFKTNCNVPFTNGLSFSLWVDVVDKSPDTFAEITVDLKPAHAPKVKLTPGDEDKVFSAVEDYKQKSQTILAAQAAEALVSKELRDRAAQDDIIVAARSHVAVGPVGILRFSIDNQSRAPWALGEVRLSWYAPGRPPEPLKGTASACREPVVDRGQEIFCAVVFNKYSLPADAKFALQVFEKNGARHPKLDGIKP